MRFSFLCQQAPVSRRAPWSSLAASSKARCVTPTLLQILSTPGLPPAFTHFRWLPPAFTHTPFFSRHISTYLSLSFSGLMGTSMGTILSCRSAGLSWFLSFILFSLFLWFLSGFSGGFSTWNWIRKIEIYEIQSGHNIHVKQEQWMIIKDTFKVNFTTFWQ